MADSDLGIGALQKFRTISVVADLANDHISPIVLNAGDIEGRRLHVSLTQQGYPIAEAELPAANLIWNPDKDDPASAGGSAPMDIINDNGVIEAVEADIPRDLLANAGANPILGVELVRSTSPKRIVTTRNIPVFIEPSPFNVEAPAITDPLKELHEAVDSAKDAAAKAGQAVERANQVIDTANILAGTTTTLKPNQPASSELSGTGLARTLNLGIPRGASIASITATTASGETPTVASDTNADGDITLALGIPRGEKGDPGSPGAPGPKGDPGDASTIASSTVAGVVKVGSGLAITNDGTLSATAQPVPPATAEQMGIVKAGDGLQVESGIMKVRAGSGLNYKASTGGVDLIVNTATADAIGGVRVGAGLSIDSTGVLSAASAGAQVLWASSDGGAGFSAEYSSFAVLTVPSPTSLVFFFDIFGRLPAESTPTLFEFPDAVTFKAGQKRVCSIQVEAGSIFSDTLTVQVEEGNPHALRLVDVADRDWGAKIRLFNTLIFMNGSASASSATTAMAAAADEADPSSREDFVCTIDWSKLK